MATKADMGSMLSEIRSVKENVIRNKDRIDTLYDMRKADGENLAKRVERIVEAKVSNALQKGANGGDNEKNFLDSRRSIRLWPIQEPAGLLKGVKRFLAQYLKMPAELIDSLEFDKIEKQGQSRRSKIRDEVLIRLRTSQQRDSIQSYASNLASVQGQAGICLDIPDYLRGLFRLFEAHAAALRQEYGQVKRAVRFDDVERSLYMDVKLESTEWHRISGEDMREIEKTRKRTAKNRPSVGATAEQRSKILLYQSTESSEQELPRVESEEEDIQTVD